MKRDKNNFQEQVLPFISQEEIDSLSRGSTHRSGCWEIDQGPEPMSQGNEHIDDRLTLILVVHQESYYVMEMSVCPSNEINMGIRALTNAIRKGPLALPEIIMLRDKVLGDEIMPLAVALGCKIKISRLKAIPQIRRDMRRIMFH